MYAAKLSNIKPCHNAQRKSAQRSIGPFLPFVASRMALARKLPDHAWRSDTDTALRTKVSLEPVGIDAQVWALGLVADD